MPPTSEGSGFDLAVPPTSQFPPSARRYRWFRAVVVAVVVAGVAAATVGLVIPTANITVQTLVRVPPAHGYLIGGPAQSPGDHQRIQIACGKSRLVLNKALTARGVADLNIIRRLPNPLEWLEKEIQVDFSVAPELLRIALAGEDADELKILVTAVREAYQCEIIDRERTERVRRLDILSKTRENYAEILQTKQESQRRLKRQVDQDALIRGLVRAFAPMAFALFECGLVQNRSAILRSQADLSALRTVLKNLATKDIMDAELQSQLAADPAVQAAQGQVNRTANRIEKSVAASKQGDADLGIQNLRQQLSDDQANLAAVKKRLTPEAIARMRAQRARETTEVIGRLEVGIARDMEIEKAVQAQVDGLRQRIQNIIDNNVQLDIDREKTAQLAEFVKRIADEEAKRRHELNATPYRFFVLEEATVQPAKDGNRVTMAATRTFVGTFAFVLLGFILYEARARRIVTKG
jgi:hypothetical protein